VPRKVAKARKDDHVIAHDDEDEMLLLDQFSKRQASTLQQTQRVMTEGLQDDDEDDLLLSGTQTQGFSRGREPGRIIGTTYPLEDFQKNLSRGDLVTKAVEDFAWVIQTVVLKPFASRRHKEMIECLQVLRETCLKV
jgi:ATP-dependent DNA helicase 2 subunit 2